MSADTSLPASWAPCILGDVVSYGSTQKAEPSEIPSDAWVLELEDIEKDTSRILQRVTFGQRKSKSTKNRFLAGDILYGKLRPYLNKVVRADADGYCTTEIIPLKPPHGIVAGYLFYWLKTPAFLDYVTSVSHGLNMPRLGTEAGIKAPFVVAPTDEQQRIADKLNAVLARVDACRERLDGVPDILKRFRQAVLAAATAGNLTGGWRGNDPTRADASTLADVLHRAHEAAGGHKAGNAAPPTDGVHDLSADMFPAGWQLLTLRDLVLPDRPITCGILKPGPEIESGVPYLRVADFPNERLELSNIRRTSPEIDQQFKRSRLRSGDLLISIRGSVGQAFRGELVPQDPNDEPAAVLLARIRAARAAAPAKSRGRNGATGSRTAKKRLELAMLSRKDIQDTHLTNILKERGPLTAESLWSASQLPIDEFYDQLKDEEARGLLREDRNASTHAPRMLEAIA